VSWRGFTGRHGETRPDEKMGRVREWWVKPVSSAQNRVLKKRAAKKRRQRDKP